MDIGLFFGSVIELFRRALRAAAGAAASHPFASVALLLIAAFAAVLLASAVEPYSSPPDASGLSQSYPGYSMFYAAASQSHAVRALYNFSSFASVGKNDVLVIAGAQGNYTRTEASQIIAFVKGGGSLILFENAREGSLAAQFGMGFRDGLVIDKERFAKREDFPVALFRLRGAEGFVVTKFPSAIARSAGGDTILETSAQSWVDGNGNLAIDDNDSSGMFTLGVKMKYGNGTLYLVGDPAVASNDLLWMENNAAFATLLLEDAAAGRGGLVVFDESHKPGTRSSGMEGALGFLKGAADPQALMVAVPALLAAALALWWLLRDEKKPAKARRFQGLVKDISSQMLVRNEPYSWMVIVIYQRLRAILVKHVDPFEREGITNRKLAAWVARDVPSLEPEFLEKLLNQCERIEKGGYAINSFEESQMLCNNLMVCMRELGAEKWKPKMR